MYTIRLAEESDAEALADLADRCFRAAYADHNTAEDMDLYVTTYFRPETIRSEICKTGNVIFVRANGPELTGYLFLRLAARPGTAEILPEVARLYVAPEIKGGGIGKALMLEAEAFANEAGYPMLWLGVWQQNKAAVAIYTHWGFHICGETVFVLGNDAQKDHVMCKKLV